MGSTALANRFGCQVLLAVLLTVAGHRDASAQRLLCSTIRPGETALVVARRITGDAGNTRQTWFQILNPASSRFVPKSTYDHIRAGWQACIVSEPRVTADAQVSNSAGLVQRLQSASAGAVRLAGDLDSNLVLWGLLVALIAFTAHGSAGYVRDRASTRSAMRGFGEKFVHEFEQPLMRPGLSDRPIQSRLRVIPYRARLDVFLAPAAGRHYPNLADHKKNVEYDVMRVVQLLRDYPLVAGRPYARGRWVVVPFQLTFEHKEAGSP